MEMVALNCNSCGASLEVGPGTNFVTCAHCGARLAVKRTGTSSYTELLESIDRKTDAIAAQLAEISHQNELERIDQEWEQERQKFVAKDQNGTEFGPSAGAGAFAAVAVGVFGVFLMGLAVLLDAWVMGLPGLLTCGFAVALWWRERDREERFELAEARYRSRREAARHGPPRVQ